MPQRLREDIPLEVFVKRSWPLLAFGAIFILGVSGFLWRFALSGVWRTQRLSNAHVNPQSPTSSSRAIGMLPRALDGVLVLPEEAQLLSFAVMIDNHADARPSSGLAAANLVFEMPVEGGMTRYLAVYDATTTVDQIGPVRSARPYFVELTNALGAVYAHVGGSPDALDAIRQRENFRDLNEFWNGNYFWRSGKRAPPHNIFTRTDVLHDAAAAKHWTPGSLRGWRFKDEDPLESATGTSRGTQNGPSIAYGGVADAAWSYDRAANEYLRSLGHIPHTERDGKRVRAKNVILVLTDATIVDSEGRLKLRTTGKGSARIFRDGRRIEATWSRSAMGLYRFESVEGVEVLLNRGTTWVEVVTAKALFENA